MGNCLASCRPSRVPPPPPGLNEATQDKVFVVKTDGKVLEFTSPVLVKDINFSGSGIALSKEATQHLPPDYELKLGQVYYILPSAAQTAGATVKRIKVVITKKQLELLLAKQVSVEELVLSRLEKTSFSLDSPRNWKPELETIPE